MKLKEIDINSIGNVRIGQTEDKKGGTGVTVIVAPNGAPCGLDIRGGGPAGRETGLLDPLAAAEVIHSVVLGGGSAFGLEAASGVMQYLAENKIGFPVGDVVVPLVCQSDIFDLQYGRSDVYPDKAMGYKAAKLAFKGKHGNYKDGSVGAGCGATVGKMLGPDRCWKSGIGSYAVELEELKVGAIICANAIGDVYDAGNGKRIAGVKNEKGTGLNKTSSEELLYEMYVNPPAGMTTNTTIGIILTNAKLNKSQLCKVAGMGHDGYARSIRPVHTSMDGDSIYAMSVGEVEASMDVVGTLANHVICEAIKRSVTKAN